MSNLGQRILMFFTFIPLILILIFVFPNPMHLPLQICVLIVGIGLAFETAQLYGFFSPSSRLPLRRQTAMRAVSISLLAIIPLGAQILANFSIVSEEIPFFILILLVFLSFGSIVPLTQKLDLKEVHERLRAYVMILVYPVLGLMCFLALLAYQDQTLTVSILLCLVFGNDTLAYLAGKFLGKKSSHPIKVSPNKTLVGFIAGFLSAPLISLLFFCFFPSFFKNSVIYALILGLVIGITTVLGDLFESSLKRSSGIKDSGQVIPGRGGLLDSLDSLIFSAPFFLGLHILVNNYSLF